MLQYSLQLMHKSHGGLRVVHISIATLKLRYFFVCTTDQHCASHGDNNQDGHAKKNEMRTDPTPY